MKAYKLGLMSLILISLWVSFLFIGEAKEPQGLVGYWQFEEGSGKKAIDSSGQENHGTIKGKPKWVLGQFGQGLEFDGTTFVEVPDSKSLDIFEELTMQAWVLVKKYNTARANNYVIDKFHVYSLIIRTGGDAGTVEGFVVTSEKGLEVRTVLKIELNKWFHFASTYDGKTVLTYIDGVEKAKGALKGKINDGEILYIGQYPQPGYQLIGVLDEMAIFNVARTKAEIVESMNKGVSLAVEADGKLTTTWGKIKAMR